MPIPSPGAPFSERYEILSELGVGSSGTTYRARDSASGHPLILKHIPIPASEAQVQALIFSGAAGNEDEVQRYYERIVTDLTGEISLAQKLAGSGCYLPFRDIQVDQREDAIGYDVYLVAEFCQTLPTFLAAHEITVLDALNLGLDICGCLQALHENGLMFHNLKPENIYRTSKGTFLLADLGLTRLDELPYASLPDSRFGSYAAPEYADILSPLNLTSELYSLGMILYRIFNGNHAPFVDEETSFRAADAMRLEGKELPAPLYADYELSAIICKACAFKPEDRYQTPEEFRQALTLYMKRNLISNAPIAPPIIADPDVQLSRELAAEDVAPIRFADVDALDETFIEHFSPVAGDSPPTPVPPDDADTPYIEPDEPKAPPKRKLRAWIPLLIVLLAAAGLVVWWFLLRGDTVEVRTLGSTEKGVDFITVYLDCDAGEADLEVTCSDAYGNTFRQPYSGTTYTFEDLSPETSYTIELTAKDRSRVTGSSSILVTTAAVTQIVSFSAGDISGTSAELSLVVSGPEPESWSVSYSASNGDSGTFTCRSHNLSLQDLVPNTTYTFTLELADGYVVEGEMSCSFTTVASATLTSFETAEVTMESVTLVWEYEGATDFWAVTCSGSDGSTDSLETVEGTAVFTGLTPGVTYTFTLDCAGLQVSSLSTCTVTTPTGFVTGMTASALSSTSVQLSWEYEGEQTGEDWMVIYSVGSSEPIRSVVTTAEQTMTLTGLIPNADYSFELATASGVKLQGKASAEVTMPEAETFTDLGLDSAFIGLFLEPSSSSWTYRDLAESRSEFLPSESIAFAVQAINGVQADDVEVEALYVIRDSAGDPVDYYAHTYQWNSIWSNDLHVGSLERTPQTPGTYTLEIYFNGQILRSKEFQIVESLS